jgi:hypothetical protein
MMMIKSQVLQLDVRYRQIDCLGRLR